MDPTQCLADILSTLANACEGPSPHEASQLLRELADWLDRDGFAPNVPDAIDRFESDCG